eukprot:1572143-Pyramimonas_sp.AAC.1
MPQAPHSGTVAQWHSGTHQHSFRAAARQMCGTALLPYCTGCAVHCSALVPHCSAPVPHCSAPVPHCTTLYH